MEKLIKSLKLHTKHIPILMLLAILILVSVVAVSYMNTSDLIGNDKHVYVTLQNLESIENIHNNMNEAQYGYHLYYVTGDKNFLKPFEEAAKSIDSLYNKLRNLNTENPAAKRYLDTLSELIKKRFSIFNTSISLQERSLRRHESQIKNLSSEGKEVHVKIMDVIVRFKQEQKNIMGLKMEMINTKARFTNVILIGGAFFSIIIFLLVYFAGKYTNQHLHDPNSPYLSREELDKIVRDRTAEIAKINQRLYNEIEEHNKDEEAVKTIAQEYRMLFEQAHDAILIFDPESHKVLDVNNRACEVYRIKREEFIGLSMQALSKNEPELQANIKITLETGFYHNFETVHYRNDCTEMLMEINASVINYRGKKAILSINRDITERILSLIPLPGS
jgi:PAS domain S-box-containing protein